jgi:phosphofructokinase-like protein
MAGNDKVERIGVLTGGGDCPGLNAVIRAVTKTAIFQHGIEVWGIEDGFLGLIRNRMRPLDSEAVSNILTVGGTILGTSNKADPAHFNVGDDDAGQPIFKDVTNRVIEHIQERRLDAVVCIGGDGTLSGANRLIDHGVRCIGLPKTIDNDLMHTDVTFGFQTAVDVATEALDRIHTTASSHHRVMIVETMGRNAGWLPLHAGVATGTDVILIPEIPYDVDLISEFCIRRSRRGKAFTLIAIGEGAKPQGGQVVVDRVVHDSPDPIRLGGVSQILAEQLAAKTHLEARATILGHVQRGGTPCAFDRVLATQLGHAAVQLLVERQWNRLVVWQQGQVRSVPIAEVADRQRTVPLEHPLIAATRAVGTCFGDQLPGG